MGGGGRGRGEKGESGSRSGGGAGSVPLTGNHLQQPHHHNQEALQASIGLGGCTYSTFDGDFDL